MTFPKQKFFPYTLSLMLAFGLAGCHSSTPASLQSQSTAQTSLQSAVSSVQPAADAGEQQLETIRTLAAETPADVSMMSQQQIRECFYEQPLDENLIAAIDGDQFDTAQNFITPEQLRLVRVLYNDFEGNTKVGELICNELISQDIQEIFWELYSIGYPIGRVVLPMGYGPNDEAVMTDNITRCLAFTWSDGSPDEHEHSLGLAIDFNSLYNPQVITEDGQYVVLPAAGQPYADRTVLQPHMMDTGDAAVQIFQKHGFTWGGIWNGRNDYQHFEKYFNHETGHTDPDVYYS